MYVLGVMYAFGRGDCVILHGANVYVDQVAYALDKEVLRGASTGNFELGADLETDGREYYVGLDMQSAMHPQTLLAYELNDQPLTWQHGAPLRLAIPVKYGIKNIKRVASIRYTSVRPADYWAERGYDWYAGH